MAAVEERAVKNIPRCVRNAALMEGLSKIPLLFARLYGFERGAPGRLGRLGMLGILGIL